MTRCRSSLPASPAVAAAGRHVAVGRNIDGNVSGFAAIVDLAAGRIDAKIVHRKNVIFGGSKNRDVRVRRAIVDLGSLPWWNIADLLHARPAD